MGRGTAIVWMLLAMSGLMTGCEPVKVEDTEFKAAITDGGRPLKGVYASFEIEVFEKGGRIFNRGGRVHKLKGSGFTDSQGVAEPDLEIVEGGGSVDPRDLSVRRLTVKVDSGGISRREASGQVTHRRLGSEGRPEVGALFDLDNPEPGPPDTLSSLQQVRSGLEGSRLAAGARESDSDTIDGGRAVSGQTGEDRTQHGAIMTSAAI